MVDFASLPEISAESRQGLRMSNYEKSIRQNHPQVVKQNGGNFGIGGTGNRKKKSSQAYKNKQAKRNRKKKTNVIDARGAVERFDEGRINGDSVICIGGGEPTIHPDFWQIIGFALGFTAGGFVTTVFAKRFI